MNDKALKYDADMPGLPTKYQNGSTYSLTWDEQGNLEMVIKGLTVKNTSYGYYQNGLRAYKNTTDNVYHDYYYDGDRLIAETIGDDKYLLFHYDENDSIYSFTYNNGISSSKYYLFKNLQGDVIEIRDITNTRVATYDYDPWGNIVSIKDASGNDVSANTTHIAYINPIRYRSYYYDVETGFYYLQSRYYDPAICRFISADSLLVVDPATYGLNLFAYCGNNPVRYSDPSGYLPDDRLLANAKACSNGTGAFYMLGCYDHSHKGRYSWYKIKQFGSSLWGTIVEISSCFELTFSVGYGIGSSVDIGPYSSASLEVSADMLTVDYNDTDGISSGMKSYAGIGATVLGIDFMKSYEEYHVFDCENYTKEGCYVEKCNPYDLEPIIDFSVSAYLVVGGEIGFSVDMDRLIEVFS